MTFDKFKYILTLYKEKKEEQLRYINSLSDDIADEYYDNTITDIYEFIIEKFLDEMFGEQLVDDMYWFLYEYPTYSESVYFNGFDIECDEDYFDYIKETYFSHDD